MVLAVKAGERREKGGQKTSEELALEAKIGPHVVAIAGTIADALKVSRIDASCHSASQQSVGALCCSDQARLCRVRSVAE